MSLTLGPNRPLSSRGPATVNYHVDGPAHRLFFDPFPRRIRAFLGGELVLDSLRAMLLHESNLMGALYVPREDVLAALTPTEHTTHCPFKGDASYLDVAAGGQTGENAVWGYLQPQPEASWLEGYVAFYWGRMDAWFDEDEETAGHPRDPYARIDVRRTSRPVELRLRGEVVAETRRALLLSEGHLPNRFYMPRDDVPAELLEVSATHTYCPYKGVASYLAVAGVADGAYYYPAPYDGVTLLRDHLAFHGDGLEVRVDGEPVETGMPPRS
ncbi:MAG: DUF427 domain-containing protein [Egibacteraceae bacterium]